MKRIILTFGVVFTFLNMAFAQPTELMDIEIADAIQNEYRFDHAVDNNRVDVQVVDGIVELTGTVDNLKAKERAEKIAKLVKGVRSVSNRVQVEPPVILSDAGIRNSVEHALLMDPATDAYEVSVNVNEKVVTLEGSVDSFQEKQLCEDIAKSVKGVIGLNNKLIVVHTIERPDLEIQAELTEVLKWDAMIEDGLIDVEVRNGKVELSGIVGSAAEKDNAFFASWVAGVRDVDVSELDVEWWAKDNDLRRNKDVTKSDDAIEKAIKDAALYDPRVYSFKINPEVKNSWVTLRGTVDNLKAKKAVEKLAENTTGVRGVTNRIKIKYELPPSEMEIESSIKTALYNNAITESWEVNVDVNSGTATLTGNVDSYLEKMEAEWAASGVDGVYNVNNDLTVNYPNSYYWWGHYPYYSLFLTPPETESMPTTYYPEDAIIEENIESELWWSPYVDRDQIDVEVVGGTAILKGTVDSWREYHKAAENAWEGGAWSVNNKLIVD